MELIDLLIRLLTGLFVMYFGISTPPARPATAPEPTVVFSSPQGAPVRSFTTIYSVDVTVTGSAPMQIQLHVTGEHGDGCELPVVIEQEYDGNTITVNIYRELPGDVFCPMMLQPYEDTIQLDGNFEPGDYVIKVNDFTVEITL